MPNSDLRRVLAGVLLALAIAAVTADGLGLTGLRLWGGLAAWAGGGLLWPDVAVRARRQGLVLVVLGMLGLLWGSWRGVAPDWVQVTAANAPLIAMLAAVSFLRLVTAPPPRAAAEPPTGRPALLSTLLGVHLFGSVINLSTVFIVAEHIKQHGTLDSRQLRLLTRGFAAAAFWSPFFAAMAAALTFAPGARLLPLLVVGIPLAAVGLALTYRELAREEPQTLRGYPVRLASLWLPGVLALLVLGLHSRLPAVPILALISLLSPLLSVLVLLARRARPARTLGRHLRDGLPAMRNELTLFLAAGVLAAGLRSVLSAHGGELPFARFDGSVASLSLVAMVALAVLGVHPVIGIAALGTVYAPLQPDPNLLAMTFLAAWSIGVALSPLSGMNLALQGAYHLKGLQFLRCNLAYALKLMFAATLALHAYAWFAQR